MDSRAGSPRTSRVNRSHIFLKAYAETGSITRASQAAQINRSMHYRRMEQDPAYKAAFQVAHEIAVAVLEDEAIRRAVEGVEEPVVYKGEFTFLPKVDEEGVLVLDAEGNPIKGKPLVIRKYSDQLLQFLLRGAKPEKYRERFQHDGTINHRHKFEGQLEDLLAVFRMLTTTEEDESPKA